MMNPPKRNPQAIWSHQPCVALPATISPLMPPWGNATSPGYSDGDGHVSFNPNTTFLHGAPQRSSPTGFSHDSRAPFPAFNAGLSTQYNYSPPAYSSASPAPPLHRGALPFMPGSALQFNHTDSDMDEIITSGSVAAASCSGFGVQDETMDTTGDIDDELDDAEEEGGGRAGGSGTRTSAEEEGGRRSWHRTPSQSNPASSGRPRKTSALPKRERPLASTRSLA
ncbi:putative methionyl-tRNA synthetase [Hordeum vulgare]|nr:putative methionyl-tRNA synthetase [Hordeum vulgare]